MSHVETPQNCLTISAATISACGSLILFTSFFLFPHWSKVQREAKFVLFVMNIFDGMAAIDYFVINNENDIWCRLQATWMQFFEIGGWIYNAFVAIEMHILVLILTSSRPKRSWNERKLDFYRRNSFYLGFVLLYGILCVSTMNAANNWALDGIWCWVKNPMDRIYYAYVALWVVIIVTVSITIATVARVRAVLNEQKSSGVIQNIADRTTRDFYIRMFIGPLLFILLHIPGSTRRLGQAFNFDFSEDVQYTLSMSQSFMDPLHGALNFFMFVLLDKTQRNGWGNLFRSLSYDILIYLGLNVTFARESSLSKVSNSSSFHSSNPIHSISFDQDNDKDTERNTSLSNNVELNKLSDQSETAQSAENRGRGSN